MKGLAALLIVFAAVWLAWPDQDAVVPRQEEFRATPLVEKPAASQGAGMQFFSAPPSTAQEPVAASVSMANTRLHGDPEAPPIVHRIETAVTPTENELADPKAYQAYEARQSVRVYASYIRAVDKQLPILRDDIARGRAIGIAPEKIAKAEEKARRLEAMRAQLLKEHPELKNQREDS
jgi:hypothetical protein